MRVFKFGGAVLATKFLSKSKIDDRHDMMQPVERHWTRRDFFDLDFDCKILQRYTARASLAPINIYFAMTMTSMKRAAI